MTSPLFSITTLDELEGDVATGAGEDGTGAVDGGEGMFTGKACWTGDDWMTTLGISVAREEGGGVMIGWAIMIWGRFASVLMRDRPGMQGPWMGLLW